MTRNLVFTALATALVAGSLSASAAGSRFATRSGDLPEIQCTRNHCALVQTPPPRLGAHALAVAPMATFATPDPTPVVVGPPAGQRYLWQGAGYPACQSIKDMSPMPSITSPYEYIKATNIPVPLGSTHASLLASFQVNLDGGPAGAAGDVGMLQVARSGTNDWNNVAISYAYTIPGAVNNTSLYNTATYHGLVNLANLTSGTGVPSEIDVRVGVFPVYTADGGFSTTIFNGVCWGTLQLSF